MFDLDEYCMYCANNGGYAEFRTHCYIRQKIDWMQEYLPLEKLSSNSFIYLFLIDIGGMPPCRYKACWSRGIATAWLQVSLQANIIIALHYIKTDHKMQDQLIKWKHWQPSNYSISQKQFPKLSNRKNMDETIQFLSSKLRSGQLLRSCC